MLELRHIFASLAGVLREAPYRLLRRRNGSLVGKAHWCVAYDQVMQGYEKAKTCRVEHPLHPGFYAVRIPLSEFLNPPAEREGERLIDSEGRVMNFLQLPEEEVTVLRRIP